jgi:5-dehydro-2-deoxygluconokinase
MKTLGYDQPLYILPFDHRGTLQTNMFGWKGSLTPEQTWKGSGVTFGVSR